jgi:zinc D-Ala-D-Ala carboxypeptidase
MELSRFFTLAEMTRSASAQSAKISNQPGAAETNSLRALCAAVLDPLRESIGEAIRVNSGFRSPKLNEHIGGARDSQHVRGEAADIESRGVSALELFQRIIRLALPFDQLIYEDKSATSKWVHVSHAAGGSRGQILKANFGPSGSATYSKLTAEEALAMTEPVMRARGALEMSPPIELGDEPGAVARKPRRKRKPERPAVGRRKAGTKTKAKRAKGKTAPKSAKRGVAKRPTRPRRAAKAAPKSARRGK